MADWSTDGLITGDQNLPQDIVVDLDNTFASTIKNYFILEISTMVYTKLASTYAFPSISSRFCNNSSKFYSSQSEGLTAYILASVSTAVLRT